MSERLDDTGAPDAVQSVPPTSIPRSGRSVELIPVTPEHTDFLYSLATDEDIGWRWRYLGVIPRRDTFDQTIWNGVLTQFVVREKSMGSLVGSVFAYNADLNNGIVYVAAGMLPAAAGSGIGIEATDLFVSHLFGCYRLRKLYMEVPEYNLSQFSSALGWLLHEEGRLVGHTHYQGRLWDKVILAMYRKDYEGIPQDGRTFGRRRRPAGEPLAGSERSRGAVMGRRTDEGGDVSGRC